MVISGCILLMIGFLCLGNTAYFKSTAVGARQIIAGSLRSDSLTLKRTVMEIFQEYFATEELKAENLEGKEKEDVDLSRDIGMLTGTAKTTNNDEFTPPQIQSHFRTTFYIVEEYIGDIMSCALSEFVPLAIIGTEVLDSMVRGGLSA